MFRHDCDDAALVEAYRRAMCVVLPSVCTTIFGQQTAVPELLGQTLLEGMSCGAPVICTNVGSMPEIVKDGISGFVVAPNNPGAIAQRLLWFRDHPQEAQAMGRAGRALILEKFTWPKTVGRCLRIYGISNLAAPDTVEKSAQVAKVGC